MRTPRQEVRNIIVTGKSGSGKQPRIDVIVDELGLKQLSTGTIFREILLKSTPLARIVKHYVENGLWVPDDIASEVFAEFFKQHNCAGFVLDGFPRTPAQAEFLIKLLEKNNSKADMIIEVHREDEHIIEHIQNRVICKECAKSYHLIDKPPKQGKFCECGAEVFKRNDESKIQNRLNEFHTKVIPTIEHLKAAGIPHVRVDGYLNPWTKERVRETVIDALKTGIDL